jgi:mevalonate kinase
LAHANGKVILLGEHAVVYGVSALAAGIEKGARAQARAAERACLRVGPREVAADDDSDLGRAFGVLLGRLGLGPHQVDVELDLPAGAGLGASAAIAVAVARAVLEANHEASGRLGARFSRQPFGYRCGCGCVRRLLQLFARGWRAKARRRS